MYKILFAFGQHFEKGGTEAVMMTIFRNIDHSLFSIDFLEMADSEDTSDEARFILENGSHIYYIPRRGTDLKKHQQALQSFFKEHTYDIVHSHMDAAGEEILYYAKKFGIKHRISHSHNTNHLADPHCLKDHLHRLYVDMEKLMLRAHGTAFVGCSKEAGMWLFGPRICTSDKYLVLNNAIEVDRYTYSPDIRTKLRQEFRFTESDYVIGHVGRFEYQKNHDKLIDIFAAYRTRNTNAKLLLIGVGSLMEDIRNKVHDLGLESSVTFAEKRNDVPHLLSAMDIFVMPSRFEGLSIALVEAQASGLYCLTTNTVSPDSDVSGNVQFIDSKDSVTSWISCLDREFTFPSIADRREPQNTIRANGFDAVTNIRSLESFYLKMLK